jgi:hypothetical protein
VKRLKMRLIEQQGFSLRTQIALLTLFTTTRALHCLYLHMASDQSYICSAWKLAKLARAEDELSEEIAGSRRLIAESRCLLARTVAPNPLASHIRQNSPQDQREQ